MRGGWARAAGAGAAIAAVAMLALGTGCSSAGSSLGYYAQAANGHLDLLQRARPVTELLADPALPPSLHERLQLAQRLRDFAVVELRLPDNASYRRYADLQRDAAVWNVVAAPELSLTLKTWCFPVMGCVGYRGYFDRSRADALAAELQAGGAETSVYGVPAYSTLGWSNWVGGDPLLNTFIGWPEADLARLVFHELAHQVAYAADDTAFNESFAVAVERIGVQRWLERHGSPAARAAADRAEARRRDFRELTLATRADLERVYASADDDATKRARKAELLAAMRQSHREIRQQRWGGWTGYDDWFARANNASLGVLAVYNDLVPQFDRLYRRCGGDFVRFYAEVGGLAALPKDQRRATLATY